MITYGKGVSELIQGRRQWLRDHPTAADATTAVLLALFLVPLAYLEPGVRRDHHIVDPLDCVLLSATLLALSLRRRVPIMVLAFVTLVCMALATMHALFPAGVVIAYLIAVYTVAAHRGLANGLIAGVPALAIYLGVLTSSAAIDGWNILSTAIIVIAVWWLGRSLRLRRAYLAELENRALRLERAKDADSRVARAEERSRIARELHDVVAHHVSVMTVQASAARRILERDPHGVQEALTTIEQLGRTALGEMRRIVGVLRTEADPVKEELRPQPGIRDVHRLVEQVRETGLRVNLWNEGEARPLPPGIDLAAFRLIQEALTNTLKHAGPQARVWVRIHYAAQRLTVQVEDDGRGPVAGPGRNGDTGHGLMGMRERVALYGGDLRVGPRAGGGFEVRAGFPLDAQ